MNTKLFLIASSLLMVMNGVNIGQAMESSGFSSENNINAEGNQDELNSNKQIDELNSNKQIQDQKEYEEEEDQKINKSGIIHQDKINQNNNKKNITFTEPCIVNTYDYKKDNNIIGRSTIEDEYENEENINNK